MAVVKISYFLIFLVISHVKGKIDPDVIKYLGPFGKGDVLVNFHGANAPVIKQIQSMSFNDRFGKIKELTSGLKTLSDKSQGPVRDFLNGFGVESQSFWAGNQMVIRNVNLYIVQGVDAFTQVSCLRINHYFISYWC